MKDDDFCQDRLGTDVRGGQLKGKTRAFLQDALSVVQALHDVRQTHPLPHFTRQARDKHRESTHSKRCVVRRRGSITWTVTVRRRAISRWRRWSVPAASMNERCESGAIQTRFRDVYMQEHDVSARGNTFPLSGAGAPHAEMATLRCSARGRDGQGVR
jgi:hypothetical protein